MTTLVSVTRGFAGAETARLWQRHPRWNPTVLTAVQWLQSVMNSAARLVFSPLRCDHITLLLRQLHWLKAPERIDYKLAVLWNMEHGTAPPSYLADELSLLADIGARRCLRSASSPSLVVRRTRPTTIDDNAFPAAATHVWNGPYHICTVCLRSAVV